MTAAEARILRIPGARAIPVTADTASGALLLLLAMAGLVSGTVALVDNSGDSVAVPYLVALAAVLAGLFAHDRIRRGVWRMDVAVLFASTCAAILFLYSLPEFLYGANVNGIVHRSLFSSAALLGVSLAVSVHAIQRLLGSTPSARDAARYPVLILPMALACGAYALLLVRLVDRGLPDLSLSILTHAYSEQLQDQAFVHEAGLRNHLLGTLLLITMTCSISILPGVGAGFFMSEYRGPIAQAIAFATTMLRAISVFIVGVAAFSLVDFASDHAAGDAISDLIRGYFRDENGFLHPAKGSFLTASAFLSLLVIPVIARATEEGLRSVPREIREGSAALGATPGHTALRILLPWAAPNIVTGLLLGAAEAAGSVAVLLFIAGTGQNGVGPLKEATSLSLVIFEVKYGPKPFQDSMAPYQFTAALLLLAITVGLTVLGLYLKHRLSRSHRGVLTSG
jgi:phosphate transport system permease protein